ncbi:beta-ketoacyl synthase N-terminal-like domain-containing protein [Bacillus atrophaeus]|uniref:beta-ketoacyl synthase N-terminal-like domain-containing protein n=1 Tax=Bacillus atrophaeus TaxID=1452 RepID=UPI001C6306F7|nr:beta-ketoacyl synthase N-terminal-like domain-containing protein [Bacillus atrophaeus]QYG89206.1 AuaD protein [Bacillus atrophaeus]
MNQNKDRIVVTGMGTVSAYGVDDKALWSAIQDGVLPPMQINLDQKEVPRVVRVNQFEAAEFLGKKGLQFMQPSSLYLSVASVLALNDAAVDIESVHPDRLGIVVSTNYSGLKMSSQFDKTSITEGPKFVSPMQAPNTIVNSPASYLAIRIQSRAFNTTIASGFCAGLDALGYAVSMLKKKNADTVVVGGTEEWNDEIEWYYENAGLLPKKDFEKSGKAFHTESEGIMPGEGSAAVVLERYEDAIKRGATILGELVSWYSCFTSTETSESRIQGSIRCMDTVIQNGHEYNKNIDLIISGANGLPKQDSIELNALNKSFPNTPILSIKNTIGETSGAAGLFQLVSSIHAIRNKKIASHALLNSSSNELNDIRTILLTGNDLSGGTSSVLVKEFI